MNEASVKLPRPVVNRILAHAQQTAGREVCGLIAARDGVPNRVYPVQNAAGNPGERFRMAPDEQIAAMRRMREQRETLFGIYHSHPHSPAEPSERDLAEAAYPEAVYLIVSLDTEGVLQMRAFRMRESKAEPLAIEVV